jgi:hypothetical protein
MLASLGLKVPKEHGAWAMLYVPFALGVLAADKLSWAVLWTLLAMTALFLARETLRRLRRAWQRRQPTGVQWRGLTLELAIVGTSAGLLLLRENLWGFLPLGGAALLLLFFHLERTEQREERSIPAQLLAIVGFAMAAPAAHYAALGVWHAQALWLWLLAWLYFASSVFHVKTRVLAGQSARRQAFLRVRRLNAAYHGGMLGLTAWLVFRGSLAPWILMGFLPLWGRTAWALLRPTARLDLKRIGVLEIFYSLNFLVFGWLAFLSH